MNPKPGPNPLRSPTRTPLSLPCRQPTPPISPNRPGPGRFLSRKVQRLAPGPLRHSPARPSKFPGPLPPALGPPTPACFRATPAPAPPASAPCPLSAARRPSPPPLTARARLSSPSPLPSFSSAPAEPISPPEISPAPNSTEARDHRPAYNWPQRTPQHPHPQAKARHKP